MNRKLLVTLIHKNIQELDMITQGFMEMTEFPMPIILLAQRKTEDIQLYIKELSTLNTESAKEEITLTEIKEQSSLTVEKEIEPAEIENLVELTPTIEPIKELVSEEKEEEEEEEEEEQEEQDALLTEEEEAIEEIAIVEEEEEEDAHELELEEQESLFENSVETIMVTENETIEPQIEEPVIEEPEIEEPETKEQKEIKPEVEKPMIEEVRKTILGERTATATHTRNELLATKDNTISSTLANKKITDIKQALSIGDRFRFQRELFRGNGEDMNKTLSYINQLATLEEVLSFLRSKYSWNNDNEAAEDFYQLIGRKFL